MRYILFSLLLLVCACKKRLESVTVVSADGNALIYALPQTSEDPVLAQATMDKSTEPTQTLQESYLETIRKELAVFAKPENLKQIALDLKGAAEDFVIAKANDILFSAVSEISYQKELEEKTTIGVKFKRNIIGNPLQSLKEQVPGYKIPEIAVIDRFSISMGFPIFGTSVPVAPGLNSGFSIGSNGTIELLNMRTFSDPRAKTEWGIVNDNTKAWMDAKLIPKWIKDHTPSLIKDIQKSSMGQKIVDEVTKDKVSRYSTITNLLTFPVKMPFTRANVQEMFLNDVFAYDAAGTVTMGVNLSYGVKTPGADLAVVNNVSLVPGASFGAGVGATAYMDGKWRVAIQKSGVGKMKVKLSLSGDIGAKANATVEAKASLLLKVKLKDGIEIKPGEQYAYKFVNLEINRTEAKIVTRTYEYNIGESDKKEVNADAWKAYLDSLNGDFETSDAMIFKYGNSSEKAVTFIEEMDEKRSETAQNGALNILVADWGNASTVKIIDRNMTLSNVEIYSLASYVEHKYMSSYVTWGFKTKKFGKILELPTGFNWANRSEKYIFALNRRIKYNSFAGITEGSKPEYSILARWNYDDNEINNLDSAYLEGFYSTIFGSTEVEFKFLDSLYKDFGKSMDLVREAMVQKVPFMGQMSVGLLPRMIQDCVTYCRNGYVNPFLLMYKAFTMDPDADPQYPMDIVDPWLIDTVTMPIPLGVKDNYPKAIKALREAIEAQKSGNPKEVIKKFGDLVSSGEIAPHMFAFFSYLTAATINGTEKKPYMGKIFELTKPVVVDGQELIPDLLVDRLSMDFSAVSGNHKYFMRRNSEVFNQVMTEILNSAKPSIDLAE